MSASRIERVDVPSAPVHFRYRCGVCGRRGRPGWWRPAVEANLARHVAERHADLTAAQRAPYASAPWPEPDRRHLSRAIDEVDGAPEREVL